MLRIALKGALARTGRLLLTSLAVILGTAFLAGSFVFTDTIQRTFDNLFADVYKDTDAVVRSSHEIDADFGQTFRANIPAARLDDVRAAPGVAAAEPDVTGAAVIIGGDGERVGGGGSPQYGSDFSDSELSPWRLTPGSSPPATADEVVLDAGAFSDGGFTIGDTVKIAGVNGSRQFTIVGSARFGDVDSPAGATFAMFDLPTAQRFLLPTNPGAATPDEYTSISVRSDGTLSPPQLVDELQQRLGTDTQVLTGTEITKETQSDVREALKFFMVFLSIFAGISLFVAAFVIYNVFSITAAQRSRESALLRAIGSSRRQVTSTLLVEAVLVGIVGSLVGLVGGIGLAKAMNGLLTATGVDIPSTGTALLPRTIVLTLVVGLLVTVVSAIVPARHAGRVAPVAAMRESAVEATEFTRRRLVAGLAVCAVALAVISVGLTGPVLALIPGILLVFIGLFVLGPLVARRFALAVGRPLAAVRGVTGLMARENSARNPKRAASTAAALLIGVTLVSLVAVVAASVKASVRDIYEQQIVGDVVVNADDPSGQAGFSPSLADEIGTLTGVKAAAGLSISYVVVGTDPKMVTVVDPAVAAEAFDVDVTAGSLADVDASGIAIGAEYAAEQRLELGDTIDVTLLDGSAQALTVRAIYDADTLTGPRIVNRELFAASSQPVLDFAIYVLRDDGTSTATIEAQVTKAVDRYGFGKVQTREAFVDDQAAQFTSFINLVYGLLGLSVFIAAFGILLTMLLSVFERRRELGLSRAVGMANARSARWSAGKRSSPRCWVLPKA